MSRRTVTRKRICSLLSLTSGCNHGFEAILRLRQVRVEMNVHHVAGGGHTTRRYVSAVSPHSS